MGHQRTLEAVVTNIAFVVAGLAALLSHTLFTGIGCLMIMLGIQSGIHHYYGQPWSRRLDYWGMYAVLGAMLLLVTGVSLQWAIGLSMLGFGGLLAYTIGASRGIIGVLVGLALIGVAIRLGVVLDWGTAFTKLSYLLSMTGVAYLFNMLGDGALRNQHSHVHGLGWHLLIASTVLFALYQLLPTLT